MKEKLREEFKPSNVWWYNDFLFFKKWHGHQKYHDGLSYWHHLYLVASLLESVIDTNHEFDEETKKAMIIAALGHDSLEDTTISKEEIKQKYGAKVLEFIGGMTNDLGDHDTTDYEQKILESGEEIRLIKMADSSDNYLRMAQRVEDNTPQWLEKEIWPVMDNLSRKLINTKFEKYQQTAEKLKTILMTAKHLARQALRFSK